VERINWSIGDVELDELNQALNGLRSHGRSLGEILQALFFQAPRFMGDAQGVLTPVQYELIATYVAARNGCDFCRTRHALFLRSHGKQYGDTARALRDGNLDLAPVSQAERLLLEFAEAVSVHPGQIIDAQIQELREAGWTEAQIAEAMWTAAFMSMVVRYVLAVGKEPKRLRQA
jgi:uncharacterized peroxidase-related enzyme